MLDLFDISPAWSQTLGPASKLRALAQQQAETPVASRLDAIAEELEAFAKELDAERG